MNGGFGNSYEIAFANLVGTIPSAHQHLSTTNSTALRRRHPAGGWDVLNRHFKSNEFEWYVQDAWRVRPSLTITFGLRHTILQTPYETSGQQVTPTVDTHTWFLQREAAAQQSQIFEDDLYFQPAGASYGKPGFWPKSKDNFAPRLAIAYSPDTKTSIRLGAGIYYDHYGEALVNTFDQNGSYGMNNQVEQSRWSLWDRRERKTPAVACVYRRRSTLPPIDNGGSPATLNISLPLRLWVTSPLPGASTARSRPRIRKHSICPCNANCQAASQSKPLMSDDLGRHLLQQLDLAEPVDYVDPSGGGDYYAAGSQLSHDVDMNGGDGSATVAPIPYFEDVFPFMAGVDYAGESATQAIYTNEWAPYRAQYGATTSLSDIDFYCGYGCPANWQSHFWQDQFSSFYALSSIGMSYYNAGQITLRHPTSHGLTMNFSYTLSKSIDFGSDTERSNEFGTNSTNTGSFSEILNTWKPSLNRGVSDFDTRHLITTDLVYALPIGRGKALAGASNALADAIVGGWQFSGINRWSSGLPFSVTEPGWTTDWQIESFGVVTQPVKMRRHFDQNGNPQFFDDPDAINNGIATGGPIRLPYPGEAGQRNNFRGDGYFNVDAGLDKSWKIREFGSLKFAWEVYNVTNSVRFDPAFIGSGLTGGNLGVASALLTVPRRMQFSLRFDF